MHRVIQVRLREAGRIHYYKLGDLQLEVGDCCIVATERGLEYGQVVSEPEMIVDTQVEGPLRNVTRKANSSDEETIARNKKDADKAGVTCGERISSHKLLMKLVYVEYSFDRHRLIFYFTADGRIDFRGLVKDLASLFKVRIELRQIGVRDEAKILGGVGCCGRTLCCTAFLKDFEPVNVKMAKIQRLPLNPEKISGVCGRLLCCLKYENDTYRKCLKEIPSEGTSVITPHGEGIVKGFNILRQTIVVDLGENRQAVVPVCEVQVKNEKKRGKAKYFGGKTKNNKGKK